MGTTRNIILALLLWGALLLLVLWSGSKALGVVFVACFGAAAMLAKGVATSRRR